MILPASADHKSLKKSEGSVAGSVLVILYRDLDKSETRRLGKWLHSPAHNLREDVRELHDYLSGGDRLFKTSALTKSRVWKRLFPDQPFDDARLRQAFYQATRCVEEFLAYENWSRRPMNGQLSLINELQQRNLGHQLERYLGKADRRMGDLPHRDEVYYDSLNQLEQERYAYTAYHHPLHRPNFEAISESLDISYLINKLRVGCNALFHQRINGTNFDTRFVEEAARLAQTYDLDAHPALAIFCYVYKGLTEEDPGGDNISKLRDTVRYHSDVLSRRDQNSVCLTAINLCVSNMNRGISGYAREAFEWYRLGFERGVITDNQILSRENYLNPISIALKLGEFDWTAGFIEAFTPLLDEDIRENTATYARGNLAYYQKDYDRAMPLLVTVDFKHPIYNLLARTLLLKIYYELGEFDALDSLLDSMTTYIRRKQLSDMHRKVFGNNVRYVRYLSRLIPGDAKKAAALQRRIAAEPLLTEKEWLLRMLGTARGNRMGPG